MPNEKAIKIKVALLQLGLSQAQIARDLGTTRVAVNRVVNGRGRSKKIENYITGMLDHAINCSFLNQLETNKNNSRNEHGEGRNEHSEKAIISM